MKFSDSTQNPNVDISSFHNRWKNKKLNSLLLESDVIPLLVKSKSSVSVVAEGAKTRLTQNLLNNFHSYVRVLCNIICERKEIESAIRREAANEFRSSLTSEDTFKRVAYHQRWLKLDRDVRLYIKKKFVAMVVAHGCPFSVSCVMVIAGAEFPRDEWPELIDSLINVVKEKTSSVVRKANSLQVLGDLCNEIQYDRGYEVIKKKSLEILKAVMAGMIDDENSSIKEAAIKTLITLISWDEFLFEKTGHQKLIMQIITEAAQSHHVQVKIAALDGLIEIVPRHYEYTDYCQDQLMLCAIAADAMKSDMYEVKLKGIKFCNKLCFMEECWQKEAVKNSKSVVYDNGSFSKKALARLLPIVVQSLFSIEKWEINEDDDETWQLLVHCLMCFVKNESLTKFLCCLAERYVQSNKYQNRISALRAFSALLTENFDHLQPLLFKTMPVLFNLLLDVNVRVRATAVAVAGKACSLIRDAVMLDTHVNGLAKILVNRLSDELPVAESTCETLQKLIIAVKEVEFARISDEDDPSSNHISDLFKIVAEALIETIARNLYKNLAWAACDTLSVYLDFATKDCYEVINKLALQALKHIQTVKKRPLSRSDRSGGDEKLSLWCYVLKLLTCKLQRPDAQKYCVAAMVTLSKVLIDSPFNSEIVDDKLYRSMSTFVKILGDSFAMYACGFRSCLIEGLKRYEKERLLSALHFVGDICRALDGKFLMQHDEIAHLLMSMIQNDEGGRRLRQLLLVTIKDLAAVEKTHFRKHTYVIVTCLIKSQQRMDDIHMDKNNYALECNLNEMHKYYLEAYASILENSKTDRLLSDRINRLIRPCLLNMIQVIVHIAQHQGAPIYDTTCFEVLCALIFYFGRHMGSVIHNQALNRLLARGRNSENPRISKICQLASHKIEKLKFEW